MFGRRRKRSKEDVESLDVTSDELAEDAEDADGARAPPHPWRLAG